MARTYTHTTKYRCPHTRVVKHDRGDFEQVIVNGKRVGSRWVTKEEWEQVEPCYGTEYVIVNSKVFDNNSGFDPTALLIRCTTCGKESFLFNTKKESKS